MVLRRILARAVFIAAASLPAFSCTSSPEMGDSPGWIADRPKNVIIMIGDGMGVAHVTAARIEGGSLSMDRFRVAGLSATHSHADLITDSAAGGTALATGFKTVNGSVSVGPGGDTLRTVLEYAEAEGMSTGLVVTCSLTHATPAVFASHVGARDEYDAIALQIAYCGVDLLFGGGWGYFLPSTEEGSLRSDDLDPMAVLEGRMPVVFTAGGFLELEGTSGAAFISPGHPGTLAERGIALGEITAKAIEILSKDPDGFFLMVEGSQIDWAAHDNEGDGVIAETVDFDGAVGAALDFAAASGNTLVVVTADHETGGFAIHNGSIAGKEITETAFTTGGHTAAMVPIFAFGPGSSNFGGILDNTEIGKSLIGLIHR